MNRHNTGWTTELILLVSQLWAQGISSGKIAANLGISRNAVVGKVHRLGLPKRQKATKGGKRKPRIALEPDFIGIPFFELSSEHCRYPKGEGTEMLFCGHVRKDESSYCEAHHAVCYREPEKKIYIGRAA